MKTVLVVFIIALSISGCTTSNEQFVKSDYSDSIHIFEYSEELTGVYSTSNKSISAVRLTPSDMAQIDKIMQRMVSDNPGKLLPLDQYKMQYVPTITTYDEKLIWVNAFCSDSERWREEILFVLDGGNCFFKVQLNLLTDGYYKLAVNGEG